MTHRKAIHTVYHMFWPGYISILLLKLTSMLRILCWTANQAHSPHQSDTMSHYSNNYWGLGFGYGGSDGLGFGNVLDMAVSKDLAMAVAIEAMDMVLVMETLDMGLQLLPILLWKIWIFQLLVNSILAAQHLRPYKDFMAKIAIPNKITQDQTKIKSI